MENRTNQMRIFVINKMPKEDGKFSPRETSCSELRTLATLKLQLNYQFWNFAAYRIFEMKKHEIKLIS